jgi:hypothetical protein
MNFDDWKCRCSALYNVMSNPIGKSYREQYDDATAAYFAHKDKVDKWENEVTNLKHGTKTFFIKSDILSRGFEKLIRLEQEVQRLEPLKDVELLSDTSKSYLMDSYVEMRFDRVRDIKSKYMEKGTMLQEAATTIYSLATNQYFETNKERKFNDYIQGEIDFRQTDHKIIHDVKVSWDIFTFHKVLVKPINPFYHWQGQGYMWLEDCDEFVLNYILLDTPKKMIEQEKKNLLFEFYGTEEEYMEACLYTDIPMDERIIEFKIPRCQEDIDRVPGKIEQAREFLNNIPALKKPINKI